MTRIASPVRAISDLRFDPLPAGRVVKVRKMVRVNSLTIVLSESGSLYCSRFSTPVLYGLGEYPWTKTVLLALRRLGVITAADANKHVEAIAKMEVLRNRLSDASALRRLAKKLGATVRYGKVEALA